MYLHTPWENARKILSLTFSRSGSLKASASSLLSITDAAATSRGVDPRIEGEAVNKTVAKVSNLNKK